jgi:2-haloacid dehalogenase
MDQPEADVPPQATREGRNPALLIFDVNETLSDLTPLGERFDEVGAEATLARTWFAELLRDGFALTVHGENPAFTTLAREHLRQTLVGLELAGDLDEAVEHVMSGLVELGCHPDVVDGIKALSELGLRLVTLSNGSAGVARRLLTDAGIADRFEAFLSAEQAGIWKPDPRAYAYALDQRQVDAAEAMLVAVHPWDTDGARRAGLATAWVDRRGASYPYYFRAPSLQVGSLVELAERLA